MGLGKDKINDEETFLCALLSRSLVGVGKSFESSS